jgi:mRNA interferase MazF
VSQSKLRPAVVLASAGNGDWVLCQITSKPYGDASAVTIDQVDFATGSLRVKSFARPGKLFTANEALFKSEVGVLTKVALERVTAAVIKVLKP